MKATAQLQELGQSLWLDNITREMLDSGLLQRYIDEFSITGLTSNPSTDANLMPATIAAVRARATGGEIVTALRTVFGTYAETAVF